MHIGVFVRVCGYQYTYLIFSIVSSWKSPKPKTVSVLCFLNLPDCGNERVKRVALIRFCVLKEVSDESHKLILRGLSC